MPVQSHGRFSNPHETQRLEIETSGQWSRSIWLIFAQTFHVCRDETCCLPFRLMTRAVCGPGGAQALHPGCFFIPWAQAPRKTNSVGSTGPCAAARAHEPSSLPRGRPRRSA